MLEKKDEIGKCEKGKEEDEVAKKEKRTKRTDNRLKSVYVYYMYTWELILNLGLIVFV